jgi:hypothetical protein
MAIRNDVSILAVYIPKGASTGATPVGSCDDLEQQ